MSLDLDGLIPATVLPMHPMAASTSPPSGRTSGGSPRRVPSPCDQRRHWRGPHLTHDEKVRIIKVVREVTDLRSWLDWPARRPTPLSARRDFQAAGADALLVFPIPAYLSTPLNPAVPVRTTRDCRGRAAADPVPAPARARRRQLRERRPRGLAMVDGVVAIKEASFDARRFVDTARLLEQLPKRITLLTGNDNFILESFLLGATGALIGFGAVMTREQVDMIRAWQEGRTDDAMALGRRVQRLADVVFAAPVGDYRVRLQECLRILGLLDAAHVRRPLLPDLGRRAGAPDRGPSRGRPVPRAGQRRPGRLIEPEPARRPDHRCRRIGRRRRQAPRRGRLRRRLPRAG